MLNIFTTDYWIGLAIGFGIGVGVGLMWSAASAMIGRWRSHWTG